MRAARIDVGAAVSAGIAAGVLATAVQIILWSTFTDALPAILFRDARFAAAIVMGRDVLPPPASFDGRIMLIATLVHFALAIIYGLILSRLIAALGMPSSLLAGAAFGLGLVYGQHVRLHGGLSLVRVVPRLDHRCDTCRVRRDRGRRVPRAFAPAAASSRMNLFARTGSDLR